MLSRIQHLTNSICEIAAFALLLQSDSKSRI